MKIAHSYPQRYLTHTATGTTVDLLQCRFESDTGTLSLDADAVIVHVRYDSIVL